MQASGGTGTPERERWNTVEELCDRYLGGRPSEAALQVLRNAEQQRPEVRDFVERAFRLMAISKFDPRDFSPFVARFFAVIAPGILPGAWGGIVPRPDWKSSVFSSQPPRRVLPLVLRSVRHNSALFAGVRATAPQSSRR